MASSVSPQGQAKPAAALANLFGGAIFKLLGIFHGFAGFFIVLLLLVVTVNRASLHIPLGAQGFITVLTLLLLGAPFGVFLIVLGFGLFEGQRWAYAPLIWLHIALLLGQAAERFGPDWVYLGDLAGLGWLPLAMPWVLAAGIAAREYGAERAA